jgi:hypothetical protein
VATIRELHGRNNNPDLRHWKSRKFYSIFDAAMLTCGIDPLFFDGDSQNEVLNRLKNKKPVNWEWALMIVKSIAEGICTGDIKSQEIHVDRSDYNNEWTEKKEQTDLNLSDSRDINYVMTMISRNEHFKFLQKEGFLEGYQPEHLQQPQQETKNIEVLALPSPQYTTPAMECLQEVCREFWCAYDPMGKQPPPKQDVIRLWLKENGHKWGVTSDRMAAAIDLIARHPAARDRTNKN